jgi:hypothetical protein
MIALLLVVSVEIDCHMDSMMKLGDYASYEVRRKGNGYTDGKRRIDPKLINELAAALEEGVPKLRVEAVVPSRAVLERNILRWPEEQRPKLRAAIADRARLLQTVRDHFNDPFHYESYPSCHVRVDGERDLDADSESRHAFMLPWTVGRSQSFSPRIGRAVSALLPPEFSMRHLFSDDALIDFVLQELSRK